ncbi:MAG TPA: SCO family protein [Vicinamibacterales bacterium]|jgi:protein SCO1/2|nr:SCO family protein [Vicinamibacterales bacterium]
MTRSVVCVALAIAAVSGCRRTEPAPQPGEADRPPFGGDFTLTDQDNKPFRLQDLRGRPALLFFGYTSCPDMCPVTMSRIVAALRLVGAPARDVPTLFVSVDPKRDTPAVLKEYVASFSAPVIGLTGTDEEIGRVASAYHAAYEIVPTGTKNYLVNHTSAIFVIDRGGRLYRYFKYDEKPETLAAALRAVLREGP